jgi:hypothetical protein
VSKTTPCWLNNIASDYSGFIKKSRSDRPFGYINIQPIPPGKSWFLYVSLINQFYSASLLQTELDHWGGHLLRNGTKLWKSLQFSAPNFAQPLLITY